MSSDTSAQPDVGALGVASILIIWCIGFTGLAVEPFWVGAIVDSYGLTTAQSGRIGAVQIGFTALSSLALAPRMGVLNRRTISIVGIVLIIIGNVVSAMWINVPVFVTSRALAGLGDGAILAAVHAAVAGTQKPDRVLALSYVALMSFAMIVYLILAALVESYGPPSIFVLVTVITIIGIPVLRWLPATVGEPPPKSDARSPVNWIVVFSLLGTGVFFAAEGALWTYVERLGVNVGLSVPQVGRALSFALALTVIGSIFAYRLGTRFGRAAPIAIGLAILAGMALVLGYSRSAPAYLLGIVLFQVVGIFVMIYLTAFLAILDRYGRVAAAAPAFRSIGNTIGPAAGSLVVGESYTNLGWLAFCLYLVALVTLYPIGRKVEHDSADGNVAPDED